MDYLHAEQASWPEVERESVYTGVRPRSVHFPLNRPYEDGLIFCDCAFNVYRLPVPPDMSIRNVDDGRIKAEIPMRMLSFAFNDPPFIPEFRQSFWHRIGGRFPQAHGTYHAWLMRYDLEYALDPDSGAVFVRVAVTNGDEIPRKAAVRCLASETREMEIWDYHYRPFRWDAARFARLEPSGDFPEVTENDGYAVEKEAVFAFD